MPISSTCLGVLVDAVAVTTTSVAAETVTQVEEEPAVACVPPPPPPPPHRRTLSIHAAPRHTGYAAGKNLWYNMM